MSRRLPRHLVVLASVIFFAIGLQPIYAADFHIGPSQQYASLEALRLAHPQGANQLKDGDRIILHADDSSLTQQLYFGNNVSITVMSSDLTDPLARRTITPAAGAQTRFVYMDGSGSTYWSKVYFEGIKEIAGFEARDGRGGGVIYAWWNQYIYTQDGKGVTFRNNFSNASYDGGGVVYYWDAIDCDFTDSNFFDNKTTGPGGALYINASGTLTMTNHTDVTIGASDGNISTFRGNKDHVNADGTGGTANSIDFTGSTGKTANLYIKTEGTGILDMEDPFRTNKGSGNYTVNIIKTGTGTWKLGGSSVTADSGGTKIEIQEGTLEFYSGASLNAQGANDSFTVKKDATVKIVGGNKIEGTTVRFEEGAILAFNMDFYFPGGVAGDKTQQMLDLAGGLNITKTTVDILNLPGGNERKGDYTLIKSDKDIQGGNFTLLFNGSVIETTASDRLGYGLQIPTAAKNTLVLHVGDTFNTVLVWNNQDAAHSGQWGYDAVNWYDNYVKHANDAFIPNDTVIFNLASGGTITLTGPMSISKDANRQTGDYNTGERGMRVSGAGNWTFNGGAIGDAYSTTVGEVTGPDFLAALVFDGSGTLTLNNAEANTYHDGTVISGGGTMIVNGVNSLGESKYAGFDTTGRLVQDSGYGIEFLRKAGLSTAGGGILRFKSGTTIDPTTGLPTAGVLDQRISVGNNSSGALVLDGKVGERLVVTTNSVYQGYSASDKSGGAVNVGSNATFATVGQLVFAGNTSSKNGGAIFAGTNSKVASTGAAFYANSVSTTTGQGGAIYLTGGAGSSLNVSGSVFGSTTAGAANTATAGGAIYVANGTPRIDANRTQFIGNTATDGGGGAINVNTVLANSVVNADNSVFNANTATGNGGAILLNGDGATLNIGSSTITENIAGQSGGAIYAGNSLTLNADRSNFINNEAKAGDGGAIRAGDSSVISASGIAGALNKFTASTASASGGAIYAGVESTVRARYADFANNTATTGDGGAIRTGANATIDVSGASGAANVSRFSNNVAGGSGGAIYSEKLASITANFANFDGNKANTGDGGAIRAGDNSKVFASGTTGVANRNTFTKNTAAQSGGAIYVGDNSEITAKHVDFTQNTATNGDGGAIRAGGGDQTVIDVSGTAGAGNVSQFSKNSAGREGGAIFTLDDSTITANFTNFLQNQAKGGDGGAIRAGDNSKVYASGSAGNHSLFTASTAAGSGGAIRVGTASTVQAQYAKFEDNRATKGSGGAIRAGDNATIDVNGSATSKTLFARNVASTSGGAISVGKEANVYADYSTFDRNRAVSGTGGAIDAGDNLTLSAKFSTFTASTAAASGGAINAGKEAVITATSATFTGNTAATRGGAINAGEEVVITATSATFTGNTATATGGAINVSNSATLHLDGSTFSNNTVSNVFGAGGAVYAEDNATIDGSVKFHDNSSGTFGGAVRVGNDAVLRLDHSEFLGNVTGLGGGGIYAGAGADIVATHSTFGDSGADPARGNTAALGGAISVNGTADKTGQLDVSGSTFDRNRASMIGPLQKETGAGGALALLHTTLIAEETSFTGNTTVDFGGAIYAAGSGTLTLKESTFVDNRATAGAGGAIRADSGITKLDVSENSRFVGNKALSENGVGGAISALDGIEIDARNATFNANEAGKTGGAIAMEATVAKPSTLKIAGATFSENIAENGDGGALYLVNTNLESDPQTVATFSKNKAENGLGGAIYYENVDGSELNLDKAQFEKNSADGGGAILLANETKVSVQEGIFIGNTASGFAGAIGFAVGNSQLDATGAQFRNNGAGFAGGAILMGSSSELTVDDAVFQSNTAGDRGGAIALFGQTDEISTLLARNATFESNTSKEFGGAIFASLATIDGTGTMFQRNTATTAGGAVHATDSKTADWTDATFKGNSAGLFGGAMLLDYTTTEQYTLSFGASEGKVSEFSGNRAGGKSSSIHFMGSGPADSFVDMTINTAEGGEFRLLDGMTVDATNNNIGLSITKSGVGSWTLGNVHDLTAATIGATVAVDEGSFIMQNGAQLLLKNAATDTGSQFVLAADTDMFLNGKNVISAETIDLAGRLDFNLQTVRSNSTDIALTLTGSSFTTAVGSQEINVTNLASTTRGVYNLIGAKGANLDESGKLSYKGKVVENLDRLNPFWTLHADSANSLLQLIIDKSPNTTMTWVGDKNNRWNQEDRNWVGYISGVEYNQFFDGDDVVFGDTGAGTIDIDPTDVVVGTMLIDSTEDYTFTGGSITGTQFDKYGSSTLTLNNKNVFDNVFIHEGTLTGGNGSNWAVEGSLWFNGNTSFRPNGEFRVLNDITFDAGSYIYLDVSKVAGQSDLIAASGVMEFAKNADGDVTVVVGNKDAKSGERISTAPVLYAASGLYLGDERIADGVYGAAERQIVIANDDASKQLLFVTDRSLALQAATVGGGSTNLALDAFGTGFGPLGPTSDDFTQNQYSVYEALENAPYLTPANELFAQLALLDELWAKREFLDTLIPTANGAAMFAVQRGIAQTSNALFERVKFFNDQPRDYERLMTTTRGQQGRHRGFCIGANPTPWFQQMGDFLRQDDTMGVRGYKTCAYGFMLGADKRVSRETMIGFGVGGNFATVESAWTQRGKANSFLLTGYAGYTHDDWTVAGNIGYVSSEYIMERGMSGTMLEASYGGDSFLGAVEVSKKLRARYLDITPFASMQLITLNVGSYDEYFRGKVAAHVQGEDSNAFLQTLGLRFGRTCRGPRGTVWNPSISAGWVHDYGDGDIRSITTFGGATPVAIVGALKHRDRGLVGLNLNVTVKRLSIFGSYDGEIANGYYGNTIQSGFTFAF